LQHFKEEELAIIQTLDVELYLSDFAEIQLSNLDRKIGKPVKEALIKLLKLKTLSNFSQISEIYLVLWELRDFLLQDVLTIVYNNLYQHIGSLCTKLEDKIKELKDS
jgi:hypothetical protein